MLLTTYASAQEKPMSGAEIKAAAGDEAPSETEMAKLSPALEPAAIRAAMKKVADWQVQHSQAKFNQDWTYAPLYLGLLAASQTVGDTKYHDAVLRASEKFQWKLWAYREFHADDEAIGQTYELLYLEKREPVRIADTQATFDRLLQRPDDPQKDLWWWCDALFMAPAGMARLSAITGNHAYLDKMDHEWDRTAAHLYDKGEHLYFRDNSYIGKTEKNGQKIFWARGNGWVLGGLANTLRALRPANEEKPGPLWMKYRMLFREMSERVAGLQQPDGLWHSGLLDQQAYALPEISGSAFFTYALAWGINEGVLDRAKYGPVVQKAWAGMLQHVYADGRLGCIQPIGAAPGAFGPTSSYVYGVGAFLLAGSELDRMAAHDGGAAAKRGK
ncbi:glycoside hydrolase family 88/105 protein [Terriglobus sp.]|uniref:glycoside hydrolase family 88/105 protein n=1 Tax=Terriglobus sp. TaxID=1889013 RepID=UPI003B006155